MPNSLDREAFEKAYAAIHPITPTKETAWICWQAGAAAERERIAAKFNQPHMEYFGSDIQDFLRDRSAP